MQKKVWVVLFALLGLQILDLILLVLFEYRMPKTIKLIVIFAVGIYLLYSIYTMVQKEKHEQND